MEDERKLEFLKEWKKELEGIIRSKKEEKHKIEFDRLKLAWKREIYLSSTSGMKRGTFNNDIDTLEDSIDKSVNQGGEQEKQLKSDIKKLDCLIDTINNKYLEQNK